MEWKFKVDLDWLNELTRHGWPTKIYAAEGPIFLNELAACEELRRYAVEVSNCPVYSYRLSSGEMDRVLTLIDELQSSEDELRRKSKRTTAALREELPVLYEMLADWHEGDARSKQRQSFQAAGVAKRKQEGDANSQRVLARFNSLKALPKRERAGHIARILELSPQYVRRLLRKAGV